MSQEDDRSVAIVGIGCRFPGDVNDVESFWKMMKGARDCTSETPTDRYDAKYFYHPTPRTEGKMYNRRGGYLKPGTFRNFDRQFFHMPPAEADHLDPQIRMLLEVTWEGLEDAGIPPSAIRGTRTGVYVGVTSNEYIVVANTPETVVNAYTNSGTNTCMPSNRISYEFDLRGPSYTIDTACSSSLYAVHQACEAIRHGDCDMAIAGGANLLLLPGTSIGFCQAQMLSPDGRCKSFDADADGYARSEGAGAIVLKPLRRAIDDGDAVYAVIRGGAMSNDGKTQGIAQPSAKAQVDLVATACSNAGVAPMDIDFVEAHGTGTRAGDSAEATALGMAIGQKKSADQPPLYLGSVKANIGHTEGAAGVAGVIKAALMLASGKITPAANFHSPNPIIPFEALNVRVPTKVFDIPIKDGRYAVGGCSSFGFGGANAHVILQEAEEACRRPLDRDIARDIEVPLSGDWRVLLLSAATSAALKSQARNWIEYLEEEGSSRPFSDVLYTAARRYEQHRQRLALVVKDRCQAIDLLRNFLDDKHSDNIVFGTATDAAPIVFVFSGMGTQWWAMGRQLLKENHIFLSVIKEIDELLRDFGAEWSLVDVLLSTKEKSIVSQTDISQPCIFAVEVALVEVFRNFGINPTAVVGHSVGEVAAAYTVGFLTLKQAVAVIYHRGSLLKTTSGEGGMMAVLGDVQAVLKLLPSNLLAKSSKHFASDSTSGDADRSEVNDTSQPAIDVAAINSSSQIVLSGDLEALQAVEDFFKNKDGFRTVRLKVTNAFHSFQQARLKPSFLKSLNGLEYNENGISLSMISTVTGGQVKGETVANASYWWSNIRQTVRFEDAIKTLLKAGYTNFTEVGAHSALTPAIKDILSGLSSQMKTSVTPTLRRPKDISAPSKDDVASVLRCIVKCHVLGCPVDFSSLYHDEGHNFVSLPHYPWQREECWVASPSDGASERKHLLLGKRQPTVAQIKADERKSNTIVWKNDYSAVNLPWLKDHVIIDVIVPAAAFVETGLAAGRELFGEEGGFSLKNIGVHKFLFTPNSSATVRVAAEKVSAKEYLLTVHSQEKLSSKWQTHATMTVRKSDVQSAEERSDFFDIELLKQRCPKLAVATKEDVYSTERNSSALNGAYIFGPAFHACQSVFTSEDVNELLVRATVPNEIRHEVHRYTIHPAFLDGCFQTYVFCLSIKDDSDDAAVQPTVRVPTSVKACQVFDEIPTEAYIYLKEKESCNGKRCADVFLIRADDGKIILKLSELQFSTIASSGDKAKLHFWALKWKKEEEDLLLNSDMNVSGDTQEAKATRRICIIQSSESQKQVIRSLLQECCSRYTNDDVILTNFEPFKATSTEVNFDAYTDVVMPLLNIDPSNVFESSTKDGFINAVSSSPMALLKLVQFYGSLWQAIQEKHTLNLWLLTADAHAVADNGALPNTGQKAVGAVFLALCHEFPNVEFRWTDLPKDVSDPRVWQSFLHLLNSPSGENEIAIRYDSTSDSFAYSIPRLTEVELDDISSHVSDAEWTVAYSSQSKEERLTVIETPKNSDLSVLVRVNCFSPFAKCSGAWITGTVAAPSASEQLRMGDKVFGLASSVSKTVSVHQLLLVRQPDELQRRNSAVVKALQELFLPYLTMTLSHHLAKDDTVIAWANEENSAQKKAVQALTIVVQSLGGNVVRAYGEGSPEWLAAPGVKGVSAIVFFEEIANSKGRQLLEHLKPFGSCIHASTVRLNGLQDMKLINFISMVTTEDILDQRCRSAIHEQLVAFLKLLANENRILSNFQNSDSKPFSSATSFSPDSVYDSEASGDIKLILPPENSFFARSGESYLVTGGLKGFGLSLAKWLAKCGVEHLHLLGRSPPGEDEVLQIDELRRKCRIDTWEVDVSDEEKIKRVFNAIKESSSTNLVGIFHCAAVYMDQLTVAVTLDDLKNVVLPKAYGAWLLHQETLRLKANVRYFVLFSSSMSLFGNSGQTSYCIANTILNSIAEYRKQIGLAATSIQFGAIGNTGYLHKNSQVKALLKSRGLSEMSDRSALDFMGRAMLIQLSSLCVQGNLDSRKYLLQFKESLTFSRMKSLETSSGSEKNAGKIAFASAGPQGKESIISQLLSQWLQQSLGLNEVPSGTSLVSAGFDSIMATDMSSRIRSAFKVNVPPVRMLNEQCSFQFLVQIIVKLSQTATSDDAENGSDKNTSADQIQWLLPLNSPESETTCHLVCFPPNSGGFSSFSKWGSCLERCGIAASVVQFPGWEDRQLEKVIPDLNGLVSAAIEAVLPLAGSTKVAFYGHSFGALIAYEVAIRLEKEYSVSLVHLSVGGWYAPHLPYPHSAEFEIPESVFRKEGSLSRVFHYLKRMSFVDLPPNLSPTKDTRTLFALQQRLPCFEVGYRVAKSYIPNLTQVSCGIDAFSGSKDRFVSSELVMEWKMQAGGTFSHHSLDASHQFTTKFSNEICEILSRKIRQH